MSIRALLAAALAATAVGLPAVPASAQNVSITARASIVSSRPETRGTIGAGITFELSRHLAVAGDVDYFGLSTWSHAVAVTGSVAVAPAARGFDASVAPYLVGGVGYHRFVADLGDPKLLGPIGAGVQAGDRFCAGPGLGLQMGRGPGFGGRSCSATSAQWGVGDLPDFYARRLGDLVVPANRRWPARAFDDAAVIAGGGVRFASESGWLVAPEARLWIVIAGGRARTSGLFGATVGYRF